MPSPKPLGIQRLTIIGLVLLGIGISLANLWYAAERSTIPLALRGVITDKRTGIEKQPGVDDVYLITLESGRTYRIDKKVYDQVQLGDDLYKVAWHRSVSASDRDIKLELSPDFYGMLWCMPASIAIMLWMSSSRMLSAHPLSDPSSHEIQRD